MRFGASASSVAGGGAEYEQKSDDTLYRVQCQVEGQCGSGIPRIGAYCAQIPNCRETLHRGGLQEEGQEEVLPDVRLQESPRISEKNRQMKKKMESAGVTRV